MPHHRDYVTLLSVAVSDQVAVATTSPEIFFSFPGGQSAKVSLQFRDIFNFICRIRKSKLFAFSKPKDRLWVSGVAKYNVIIKVSVVYEPIH